MRGLEKESGVRFRMVMRLKGPDDEFCIFGSLQDLGRCLLFRASLWSREMARFRVHAVSHSGVRDLESTRENPCLCRWLEEPSQCGAAPGMSLDPSGPSVPLLEAKWPES